MANKRQSWQYLLPPKEHVRPHGKLFHVHEGQKMIVNVLWVMQRKHGKVKHIRIGSVCFVCGFKGNEVYKRANLEAVQKLLTG